jgi:hypothetical protein
MQSAIPSDSILIQISPIRQIHIRPNFVNKSTGSWDNQSRQLVRCAWLPNRGETALIVEKYIRDIIYIQPIVLATSLRSVVERLYSNLAGAGQISHGNACLVLAVLASVTYFWTSGEGEGNLFSTAEAANQQTLVWVKATLDVLDNSRDSGIRSIEILQAIIIVSMVVCNLEGVSQRYRTLISTALTLGCELGLHRLNESERIFPSNVRSLKMAEDEIGRRLWWYLIATDW